VAGRGDDAALQLSDGSVSRRHAKIRQLEGHAQLEDLASQNGTLVNSERINGKPRPLVSGDTIAIGATIIVYHSSVVRDVAAELRRDDPSVRTFVVGDRSVVIADPAMARLYELLERLADRESSNATRLHLARRPR